MIALQVPFIVFWARVDTENKVKSNFSLKNVFLELENKKRYYFPLDFCSTYFWVIGPDGVVDGNVSQQMLSFLKPVLKTRSNKNQTYFWLL